MNSTPTRITVRADEGRPDMWPSVVAGSRDGMSSWCDAIVTDDEIAAWSAPYAVTDGRTVPTMFARMESERWNDATVRPVIGRGNDQGGNGRSWSAIEGVSVDLERAADAWLLAAGYPTDRPDAIADTVDPFTMLDYTRHDVKPDRLAWRGAAHYRIASYRRDEKNARTVSMTNARCWNDRTYSDPAIRASFIVDSDGEVTTPDDAIATYAYWLTATNYVPSKVQRKANRTAKTVAKIAAKSVRDAQSLQTLHDVDSAPLPNMVDSVATTAVYGRPVTAWTASARSLPRIVKRASEDVQRMAADLAAILASTVGQTTLGDGLVLDVVGCMVDDGVHGPMSTRDWARRAAIAGVTID